MTSSVTESASSVDTKTYLSISKVCIYTVYAYKMWVPLSKNPLTPYLLNF